MSLQKSKTLQINEKMDGELGWREEKTRYSGTSI